VLGPTLGRARPAPFALGDPKKNQDVEKDARAVPCVDVSNVLNEEKKQQVIALGRMGWSLRRIQRTTGVRRETAAGYLKGAGLGFRAPGGWGRQPPAAKPAKGVIPDPGAAKPGDEVIPGPGAAKPGDEVIPGPGAAKPGDEVIPDPGAAKPAKEVITDFGGGLEAGASRAPEPEGAAVGRRAPAYPTRR